MDAARKVVIFTQFSFLKLSENRTSKIQKFAHEIELLCASSVHLCIMANISNLIGNTPLVEIKLSVSKPGVKIYGKLEGQNPGGSVKDRAAYGMIKGALDRGDLKPGIKLLEATSGNTGIALAMVARLFGVEITLLMPENSTDERVQTMEAYGAEVILTPAARTIE